MPDEQFNNVPPMGTFNDTHATKKGHPKHHRIVTDVTESEAALKGMLREMFAANPECDNVAAIFAVGDRHETVFLRPGTKATAQFKEIESRGGKLIGGFIYGKGTSVPFAFDTEPGFPNLAFIDNFLLTKAQELAARN